jgi:hypothetical protein
MSKMSISDLHHANDLAFVESINLHDGDVLKAATERAIAARIAGGRVAIDDGCGTSTCPDLIAGGIMAPVEPVLPKKPLIAGGKPAYPHLTA